MSRSILFAQTDESGYYNFNDSDNDEPCPSSSSEDEQHRLGSEDKRTVVRKRGRQERQRQPQTDEAVALAFEHSMESNLDRICESRRLQWSDLSESNSAEDSKHYNEVYFDSDEDTECADDSRDGRSSGVVEKLSNDELLYNPLADEKDQRWVDARRRAAMGRKAGVGRRQFAGDPAQRAMKSLARREAPLPYSDAVLSCPCCMITLCRDCQRHESYANQYRAMFVTNCTIDTSQLFTVDMVREQKIAGRAQRSRKRLLHSANEVGASSSGYSDEHEGTRRLKTSADDESANLANSTNLTNSPKSASAAESAPPTAARAEAPPPALWPLEQPSGVSAQHSHQALPPAAPTTVKPRAPVYSVVRCSQCNTKVAVYDQDEVYHFFNVLTGE